MVAFYRLFLWLEQLKYSYLYWIILMAEDQPASQLENNLVTQLLTSVKTLQAEVAALKSGATGGSGSQPPLATLSQTNNTVSGKDPPVKRLRSEEGEDSEE